MLYCGTQSHVNIKYLIYVLSTTMWIICQSGTMIITLNSFCMETTHFINLAGIILTNIFDY